ncbi:MAG TPA: protein-glutamate O-methyltransferase CheR [Opitutaceae bacterium]|nr:protein-glutamate O-methyltransferase CheR [Opitutaceae bacterium]
MSALSLSDFDYVRNLVRGEAAIVLETGKEYLVEARLTPLAQREGFGSLEALIAALRKDRSQGPLQAKAVDALTTNETYFFRDFHPFEALRKTIIPDLIALRQDTRRLTIWCAACSSGQEPFTIAMLIREHFPQLASWQVEIVATDLSPTVLKQAEAGTYNQIEVNRGLPAPYLIKYFTQSGAFWVVKPEIRKMVQFKPLNLIQPWPILPPCDVIFIRNVMIYFDADTKKAILKKLRNCLRPQGSLFLGCSETTLNLDPYWVPISQGSTVVYRPALAKAA